MVEKPIEQETEQVLERWFNGQLYVATSANYRLRRLAEMGFKDIHPVAVDGDIEKRLQISISQIKYHGHFDPYSRGAAAAIAEAKCQALIEAQSVPADAMVFAADTFPCIFKKETAPDALTSRWKPEALHKLPPTAAREDIKERIEETISTLLDGYKRYRQIHEAIRAETKKEGDEAFLKTLESRDFERARMLGHMSMRVEVTTGIAIRFPNETKIKNYSATAALFPERIYRIADNHPNATEAQTTRLIGRLAEQILRIMEASPVSAKNIPGCINWGDPNVRRFLRVEAWNLRLGRQEPEQGVYLGLPAKKLRGILEVEAGKLVTDK